VNYLFIPKLEEGNGKPRIKPAGRKPVKGEKKIDGGERGSYERLDEARGT
jgi:hypothetical protein